jgi:hypothetical protein
MILATQNKTRKTARNRVTERQTATETQTETDRQTETERDRQIEREGQTDRQTDKQTDYTIISSVVISYMMIKDNILEEVNSHLSPQIRAVVSLSLHLRIRPYNKEV